VVTALEEIPGPLVGVVIANELLDNLPAAVAVRSGRGWRERVVAVEQGRLAWSSRSARPEVAAWAERYGGRVPPGGVVEVQLEAAAWLRQALGLVASGAVLIVDYGDTAAGLGPRRAEGTLRTYRSHHLGPDPLLEPGETDITMDVNFSALAGAAREAGARVSWWRQARFLERWGLGEAIAVMRARERALARAGAGLDRLRVRSEITAAEALLHPRGLGDFRVLLARR
jgi:SAM-dependent MidA family methyltransferase